MSPAAAPAPGAPRVLDEVLDDLVAEGARLRALAAHLSASKWRLETPSTGWSVAAQIAHLAWTDETALLALHGDDDWDAVAPRSGANPAGLFDNAAHRHERGT